MKDLSNCPYCQAEAGLTNAWGLSPEGWSNAKKKHDEKHL